MGLMVVAALAVTGVALWKWSDGDFADRFHFVLITDRVGDGVAAGSDVKFHGYRIGEVESIVVTDHGRQRIELSTEPGQSTGLTTDLIPSYTASNIFAGASIGLVPTGIDPRPLHDGQMIDVPGGSSGLGTLTNVLGRAGSLTSTLSDPEVLKAFDTVLRYSEPGIALVREALPLLSGLADDQKMPVGRVLADLNTVLEAVTPVVVPAIDLIDNVLETSEYLDDPGGLDTARAGLDGVSDRFVAPFGRILGENAPYLRSLIDVALDFSVPVVASVGTIPHAYSKLTGLVRRTGDAFQRGDDGGVRLLVDVLLTKAPQIATPLLSKEREGRSR
ncbi:MlaD family protein [Gordonia sp. HY002]|uniref:MlaD family protein n=1 Tax=Gordonia zhenghanii TaxID=2911516 RepID=UPI001EF002E1|nr:MlaD family protein [Gordonia zhenghanii]MCF8571691.1 MlaD family protein [Gordonia zhenghanii]MCF8602714.1 MlaD family protein [Gordonia zhenghanii]